MSKAPCMFAATHRPGVPCAVCGYGINHARVKRAREESLTEFFGVEQPSVKYCWGVVVHDQRRALWFSVAWFSTRRRAVRYAQDRYIVFAIARLMPGKGLEICNGKKRT